MPVLHDFSMPGMNDIPDCPCGAPDFAQPPMLSDMIRPPVDMMPPPPDNMPALDGTGASAFSYLGSSAAFVTGGRQLNILSDTITPTQTVSAITQTFGQGAVANVHVVYAKDSKFATQVDALFTYDKKVNANDQWYFVFAAQPSGTTIYWYIYAVGFDGKKLYDPTTLTPFSFTSQ